MCNIVKVWNLGRVCYDKANKLQRYLAKLHDFKDPKILLSEYENLSPIEKNKCIKNTLLLMEHEPVYTTGLRECITDEDHHKLEKLGADYRKVDRGGLATFHGPGQLTVYPILNLRHFQPSVKWYVDSLEETAILTCQSYGLKGKRSEYTGVWIGNNKICAIGVHISRGITTHGVGLNCCTDLRWFHHIVPCGIDTEKYSVTSLTKELGVQVELRHTIPTFKRCFGEAFGCFLVDMDDEEKEDILETMER